MSTNWLERARDEIQKSPDRTTAKTAKTPISSVLAVPQPGISEIFADLRWADGDIPANSGAPVPPGRLKRFEALRKMMAEDDQPRLYYFWPDTESSPDYVIVACAKRGVAAWEMTIERDKWDPFRFLELIERGDAVS